MSAKLSVHLVIVLMVFAALIGSVFIQPAPASAADDWYVATAANGGNDANSGDAAHPWEHINYAIGKAAAGDTIHIGLGTFVEQVVITKPLTLLGTAVAPSPGGTFIAAPADGARTNYTAGDGTVFDYVILAHDTTNVIVSTLTVYAAGARKAGADYYATVVFDNVDNDSGIIGFDSGCVSGAFNNNIADIDIAIWDNSIIRVQNSLLVDFVRSGVECNDSLVRVHNSEINAEVPGATCVRLDNVDPGVVDDNLLLSVGNGVVVVESRTVTIVGNELHGTAALNGIQSQTAENILIQHNTIYGFQAGVIELGTTAVGSIASNEIFDCADGVALNNATSIWVSVYDNLIYDNGRGLYHASQLYDVTGNIFYHNTTGIESANAITAHCNAIVANTTAGLVLTSDGTFNYTNNYWGDNSGPNVDGAGPGTGDLIDTNGHTVLDFDPWAAMNLTATPATIVADGVSLSTLDLDCTRNSDGDLMGCNMPNGTPVHFTTTAGTLTSATAPLIAGHAVTSLISSTTPGAATVGSAFQAAPTHTVSTANVTFTAGLTVTTGTGVYVSPSWFYLTGNLTGLGASDNTVTPYIDYWGPADGTWTMAAMDSAGPFNTPDALQTPPGDMPAGAYTFRAKAQGNQSGLWAYGDIVTFIFQPPAQQPGINAGPGSHGASLTSITSPSALNPPNLQVTSATISSSSITAGSPVTVSADVANAGGASGAAVVKVYLNSEVAGSQGVNVAGGSTTPVTFTLTPSQPGEYSVRVNNVQAGVLRVTGGSNSDSIFAIAFAAFIVILAVLLTVYVRQRRMAV